MAAQVKRNAQFTRGVDRNNCEVPENQSTNGSLW